MKAGLITSWTNCAILRQLGTGKRQNPDKESEHLEFGPISALAGFVIWGKFLHLSGPDFTTGRMATLTPAKASSQGICQGQKDCSCDCGDKQERSRGNSSCSRLRDERWKRALPGVAQWTEHQAANWKVTGLITSQVTCLRCRPDPQLGVYRRGNQSNVSHPLLLPHFLPSRDK